MSAVRELECHGPLGITSLRKVPGHHTLAEAREPLEEFHLEKEKVVMAKEYTLFPSSTK